MARIIKYSGWYSAELCQEHQHLTFVFGDNVKRFGMGGQAIIRHEPNSYGIPTKRLPSMASGSFFEEGNAVDLDNVLSRIEVLWGRLKDGHTIVIPINEDGEVSLGLERARLKEVAPSIYSTIVQHVEEMSNVYGVTYGKNSGDLTGTS